MNVTSLMTYVIPALLILVAIILLLGLINMARGGSASRSQNLMRLRVVAQFLAVLAIVAGVLIFSR